MRLYKAKISFGERKVPLQDMLSLILTNHLERWCLSVSDNYLSSPFRLLVCHSLLSSRRQTKSAITSTTLRLRATKRWRVGCFGHYLLTAITPSEESVTASTSALCQLKRSFYGRSLLSTNPLASVSTWLGAARLFSRPPGGLYLCPDEDGR